MFAPKSSSAADINIMAVEGGIRRISLALARLENGSKRRKSVPSAELRRLGMVLKPIWQYRRSFVLQPLRRGS
jgi:hypothetical protein